MSNESESQPSPIIVPEDDVPEEDECSEPLGTHCAPPVLLGEEKEEGDG